LDRKEILNRLNAKPETIPFQRFKHQKGFFGVDDCSLYPFAVVINAYSFEAEIIDEM
jgi:hypothetical protein